MGTIEDSFADNCSAVWCNEQLFVKQFTDNEVVFVQQCKRTSGVANAGSTWLISGWLLTKTMIPVW